MTFCVYNQGNRFCERVSVSSAAGRHDLWRKSTSRKNATMTLPPLHKFFLPTVGLKMSLVIYLMLVQSKGCHCRHQNVVRNTDCIPDTPRVWASWKSALGTVAGSMSSHWHCPCSSCTPLALHWIQTESADGQTTSMMEKRQVYAAA